MINNINNNEKDHRIEQLEKEVEQLKQNQIDKSVIDKIIKLSEYYGSIGRGAGHKSEMTTYI